MKSLNKILHQLYKKISYQFFYLIYGKIDDVILENNNKVSIKKIEIDKFEYKVFSIKDSRLFTDTVHDTALIINNKIVEGASFQLRNHKNVNPSENIVFQRGTPKFKRIIKGRVLSLLMGGGGNYNYWHWLLDVIPRLKFVEKDINDINYFLLPNIEKKFQYETIKLLEIPDNKTISSKKYNHIQADEFIVTSHPYNLTNNPWVDHLQIPSWIYKFLKEKFLRFAENNNHLPQKFYIDRNDTDSNNKFSRFIINENEVRKCLVDQGYSPIKLAELSFIDQISLFNNAKSIVGLHGAGFANCIFCSPSTNILELKSKSAGDIIKNLAIQNQLSYNEITSIPETINYFNQSGDIKIDIDLLNKILKSI